MVSDQIITHRVSYHTFPNLYLKKTDDGFFIILIFVDDIIFGGNDKESDKFFEEIKNEFEMSMIGEIKFFLGLQI